MKTQMRLLLVAAASTLAVACGGQEASDANQTAAGEMEQPADDGAMAGMANDPNNPFGQAEMQMNERMMAAVGTNAADNWTRKMIEHHRGAVDMSNVVLGLNPTPEVAEMARMTIDKQQKEIGDLERMVREGAPSQQTAELYRPAMMQMHERMMAATGANPSETWMRKMIEHHKGAIAMSDVVLAQQPPADIRAKAQKTKDDMRMESAMLERMLRGEPAEPREAAAAPKAAPAPKVASAATTTKAAPPKAAERTVPAPKAETQSRAESLSRRRACGSRHEQDVVRPAGHPPARLAGRGSTYDCAGRSELTPTYMEGRR